MVFLYYYLIKLKQINFIYIFGNFNQYFSFFFNYEQLVSDYLILWKVFNLKDRVYE